MVSPFGRRRSSSWRSIVLPALLFVLPALVENGESCSKTPIVDGRTVSGVKQPGDNGYRLAIRDEPTGYEPGKIYNRKYTHTHTHCLGTGAQLQTHDEILLLDGGKANMF
uniref:Uncharacterized protein n=1 Tax=Anopheles melas TaxID=34690 RepID=A0A182THG9_9DIPT